MFHQVKKVGAGVAALAAFALGGAAFANATTAHSTTTSSQGGSGTQAPPAFSGPRPGTAAHEDAEKTVTGATADKARAAAVKAVGSGTAGTVTTDYTGTGYETTVTKPDGSKVEVHLGSSFRAFQGPGGGHGGPPSSGSGGPGYGGMPPTGSGYGATPPASGYSG